MTLVIGILASTRGTDMQIVIDSIEARKIDAKIACVISNKKDAQALERARQHNLEAIFIDLKGKSQEEYDQKMISELKSRNVELILLIGYNKFLSSNFVNEFKNRIMNIHPSLLPAFTGWDKNVHKAVLDYGVKITGCTLHFVDESQDAGPIIIQKAVKVLDNDNEETLKARVQQSEMEAILEAIILFSEGRLIVEGRKVRIIQ